MASTPAPHAEAMALVAPHCDLVERLALVPPSARVRGVFFRALETALDDPQRLAAYRRLFPRDAWSSLRFYPLRDYLIRLAAAGAVLRSPERVHVGIEDVCLENARAFGRSLMGRALLRLLSRDPRKLTEQGLAARRQTCTYGKWQILEHGPRKVEMVYESEYLWIESAIAGSARGTYASCDTEVRLTTRLTDRFNGSTLIEW